MHEVITDIRIVLSQHLLSVIIIYSGMRILDLLYSKLYYTIELARRKRFHLKKIKLSQQRYSDLPDIDKVLRDIQDTHETTTTTNSAD